MLILCDKGAVHPQQHRVVHHLPEFSHAHTLTLSHAHTLTLSHSHTLTLTHSHTLVDAQALAMRALRTGITMLGMLFLRYRSETKRIASEVSTSRQRGGQIVLKLSS